MSNRDMSETTMELLGKLIPVDAGRDAIHIAVAPVVAEQLLQPGQHIGLIGHEGAGPSDEPIGIVDPFLPKPVREGERFFMFLYPRTITSLRHEWTHPSFAHVETKTSDEKDEAETWIEQFAYELDQTPRRLMRAAALWVESEEWTYDNSEQYKNVPTENWPIFWKHYETLTGKAPKDKTEHFFTCSC